VSDASLGTARGKIVIDTDLTDLAAAEARMATFGKRAQASINGVDVQPLVRQTSTAAVVIGAAVVAGFGVAVNAAANFEQGLSNIQAVSGATADQMGRINDAALRIGADTTFSATQAAQAMEELVKAGISVEDVLSGAADATVALAAAGGVELPEAATIASNAMNQFNLKASDMVKIADKIAGAANSSAIDVSQFGLSLAQVGAVANLAGVSFDDTATAIALMGNAGIVGSDAGTSLKAMFLRLNPSTKEAADLMRELGIVTEDGKNQFYDAQGNMRSLAEVSDVLGGALAGMTKEQQQATLNTLFGSDAIRAAAVVAQSGSEAFNAMAESMNGMTAAEVAAVRLDNMKGSIEQLRGSAETLAIMVGQAIIPALTSMVENITQAVNWFNQLDAGTRNTILTIAGIGGALLLAAGSFGFILNYLIDFRKNLLLATGAQTLFTASTTGMSVAQKAAAVATRIFNSALLANPIVRIVSLILLLVGALVTLAGGWDQVIAAFRPVMDALQAAFEPLIPIVQQLSQTLGQVFGAALKAIMPILMSLISSIFPIFISVIEALAPILGVVAQIVAAVLGPAMQILGAIIGALAPLIVALLEAFKPLIDILLSLLVPVLDAVVVALKFLADGLQFVIDAVVRFFTASSDGASQASTVWAAFSEFINGVVAAIAGFFQGLWDQVVAVWDGIRNAIAPVVEWFQTYVSPTIQALVNLIAALMNFLWQTIQFVWQSIFDFITAVVTNVSNFIASAWGAIIGFVAPIFQNIYNFISGIFQKIFNFVSGIVNGVVNFIRDVWSGIIGFVAPIFEGVYNAIKSPLDRALAFISGIQQTIQNAFAGAGTWLLNAGRNIIDGLIRGIQGALGFLKDVFTNITNMIPKVKGPPERDKKLLTENGKLIMQSLISGLQSEVGNLMGMLGGLNVTIPAQLDGVLAGVGPGGNGNTTSRTFQYYAAPGSNQLSGQDELELAMRRGRTSGW
jgi:TP901 family phage tail tape measure protein